MSNVMSLCRSAFITTSRSSQYCKCHKILHCSRHSVSFISSPLLLVFYSAFTGTGALTEVTFASYMTGGVRK